MRLITAEQNEIVEGQLFNKWMWNRIFKANKNVIQLTVGATGSGKSYTDLRIAELWYQFLGDKPFPESHICFSVDDVIKLLDTKTLKKGDLIILEEGGVNLGSLDFQSKISKVFTYVMQSFRNMNLILIINLPYQSMLNKSARMLTHCSFAMAGIDKVNKLSRVKPKFHQVNEDTGKVYRKYLKASINGHSQTFKRFVYKLPSKELRDKYEKKKNEFVSNLISDSSKKIDTKNSPFTKTEQAYLDAFKKFDGNSKKVAEFFGVSLQMACRYIRLARISELKQIKETQTSVPT